MMAGEQAGQLNLFGAGTSHETVVRSTSDVVRHTVINATPPNPESKPKTSTNPQGIQDAGAELMANRRNRNIAARTWADLAQLNDALRVKETVKATIWPKPDYKQLIDDGMKPMVAHLVKQVYDSVAAKPQPSAGGILDDARLQTYVAALNRIERGLMQWVNDRNSVSQWAKANARVAAAMLGTAVPVSELATESRTLLESVFPGGWKAYRNETMVAGGNRLLGALQPGYEEVRRAVKGLEAGWPEKREAWEVQGYRVVENPPIEIHQASHDSSRFFVTVANEGLPSGGFDSRQDAEAAAVAIRPFVLFGKRGFVDSCEVG